jgi:hypothetical protein
MPARCESVAALRDSITEKPTMPKTVAQSPEDDDTGGVSPSANNTPEASTTPPTRPEPPDPFDPASLRLGSDYAEGLGVKRVISTIPVRKPNKSEWFRIRPGEAWRLTTAVLEIERGVDRATFLLAPALRSEWSGEVSIAVLLTCINRSGDLFLWRIKLPGPDGRSNTWTDSAIQIATAAESTWCRMVSDTANGHYTHFEPTAELPEPKWPEMTFGAMLKIAFRDRMIDTPDHPVLRELRGGV